MRGRPGFVFTLLIFIVTYGHAQDTLHGRKFGWLQFNMQAAAIGNASFSNISTDSLKEQKDYYYYDTKSLAYTKNSSKPVCFGYIAGVELVFGKRSGRIQGLFQFNHEVTNSSFGHITDQRTEYSHYFQRKRDSVTVDRKMQCLGISAGINVNVTSRWKLSMLFSLNEIYRQTDIKNGYNVYHVSAFQWPGPSTDIYDSTNYHNAKFISRGGYLGGFKFRLMYDVNSQLSVYVAKNFGIGYVAPWWMTGVCWYPFRKLR